MDRRIVLMVVAAVLLQSVPWADELSVLRDPTAPIVGSGYSSNDGQSDGDAQADGLGLQAVSMSNGVRYAVIDGKSYRTGQEFRGFVVRSITRDSVVLATADGRESKTLWLFSNRVNK